MDVITIPVEKRDVTGRRGCARLREAGKVPAVLYGGQGKDPLQLTVDSRIVDRELRKHHRVFKLAMGDRERPVYMQEIQFDTLSDAVLHIDFKRIDLDKPLALAIEIVYIGHPVGATHGGALVKDLNYLQLNCLPHLVPHEIQVPVKDVDLGDRITAGEVELPEGVTLAMDPEVSVCHIPGSET